MAPDSTKSPKRTSASLFALSQIVLIPAIAYATLSSGSQSSKLPLQPTLRNTPRVVRPLYDYPLVISDQQLHTALCKLRPPKIEGRPKINHIDHALRFWGVDAEFEDASVLSGKMMAAVLTRDDAFRRICGEGARPLLMTSRDGLRFRTQEGSATSSHVDHTLATLAEAGLSLNQPLLMKDEEKTQSVPMAAVVRDATRRFGINQQEYEWTALVLGLYDRDFEPWQSSEGERITMDHVARRIMRQDYGQGCCYGGHRLFTLTLLLRIDEEQRFFGNRVRLEVKDHLGEATCRLMGSQSVEGFWSNDWPGEVIGVDDTLNELGRRLLATGHALEWWAMAPAECQPPRERVIRGAQWLVSEIEKMDEATVAKNYTFLTHAGRALALWRGDFPAALWNRLGRESGQSAASDSNVPEIQSEKIGVES